MAGETQRGKGRAKNEAHLDVLLPSFSLPIGRFLVNVETNNGLEISPLLSNLEHQHRRTGGLKLLHFSLDELFYPRLSLAVYPSPHVYSTYPGQPLLSRALRFLAWSVPMGLSLVFLFYLLRLDAHNQMKRLAEESYPTSVTSLWDGMLETVTVTTTVTSTVLPSTHSKWWFGETPVDSISQPTTSARSLPAEALPTSLIDPINTNPIPTSTVVPPTPPVVGDMFSLIPLDGFPFPWPLRFDIPPFQFELPLTARETMDIVLKGLGVIWQGFRKVYHYPLDPP